jgi:hypothetical protein
MLLIAVWCAHKPQDHVISILRIPVPPQFLFMLSRIPAPRRFVRPAGSGQSRRAQRDLIFGI